MFVPEPSTSIESLWGNHGFPDSESHKDCQNQCGRITLLARPNPVTARSRLNAGQAPQHDNGGCLSQQSSGPAFAYLHGLDPHYLVWLSVAILSACDCEAPSFMT